MIEDLKNFKKPELLSPAGNFEKLKFALNYGADGIYIGAKSFSLRDKAQNFSVEEIKEATEYTHNVGKKIYLATNIFFHDKHFDNFKNFIDEIKDIPIDGLILSDIGAISYVREKYPHIPIHISTQANTTNSEAAKFYEKIGIKRIILARELNINEIKRIRDSVSIELETFIHGAMCISYSGRCLLSNYFTNQSIYRKDEKIGNMKKVVTRDANLGDCAQSCRWEYYIVEKTRMDQYLPIIEEENGTYILSSKDLNLSNHIPELIRAGINSFKIEGRMKSVYYVANVTRVYRSIIDLLYEDKNIMFDTNDELNKVSHREYTTGFYFNENKALCPTSTNQYIREALFLGYIVKKLQNNYYLAKSANQIQKDYIIEVIDPIKNQILQNYKIFDIDYQEIEKVHPDQEFILNTDVDILPNSILRTNL